MFELKELLVDLGLIVGTTAEINDVLIYRQKLAQ